MLWLRESGIATKFILGVYHIGFLTRNRINSVAVALKRAPNN